MNNENKLESDIFYNHIFLPAGTASSIYAQ